MAESVDMIWLVLVKVYLDVTFLLHLEMDVPELRYEVVDLNESGLKVSCFQLELICNSIMVQHRYFFMYNEYDCF